MSHLLLHKAEINTYIYIYIPLYIPIYLVVFTPGTPIINIDIFLHEAETIYSNISYLKNDRLIHLH